jgi:hypothetical protein
MSGDEEAGNDDNNNEMEIVEEPGLDMTTPKVEEDADPDYSCGKRFRAEWGSTYPGWFSLQEGDKTLDIPASFGSTTLPVRVIKFCLMGWTLGTLIYKWSTYSDNPDFFLAYLTHWGLIFATLWLMTSFVNSLVPPSQPINKLPHDSISLWTKYSWLMFEVAAQFTFVVTVLYWTLDYQPGVTKITYVNLFAHGVDMILVWIDGLVINRIPVRWKHVFLPMFLAACYVAWLVIHQVLTDIGIPGEGDGNPETNDDLIYPAVDFETKTTFSSVLCVMVVLVFVPLVHWLLWGLSLGCPCQCNGSTRRYLSADPNKSLTIKAPTPSFGEDGRWVVVDSSVVPVHTAKVHQRDDSVDNVYEEP